MSSSVEQLKAAMPAQTSTKPQPVQTATPAADIMAQLGDLLKLKEELETAKKVQAAVKATAPAKKEIDWSTIAEKDIINMSVDIPVIDQEVPAYMDVHLLDKSYVARWVNKMPERLGVCLASGYSYVTKEDMDPLFPIVLNFDTEHHYSCGDVVCLRIPKSRYYPAIRANHIKTMAIHGKNQVLRETGRALNKAGEEQLLDQIHKGGMTVYEPSNMDGTEISKELFAGI